MEKFKILQELLKCDIQIQSEKMLLEKQNKKQCQQIFWIQGCQETFNLWGGKNLQSTIKQGMPVVRKKAKGQ